MLAGRFGAVVLDADAIVREVQAVGGLAYAGIVERFGPGVVLADGSLDRAAPTLLPPLRDPGDRYFPDEPARARAS